MHGGRCHGGNDGKTAQPESDLVDLSMSLFDLSSDRLLSLVERFFRSMGLTDLFQVRFVCVWLLRTCRFGPMVLRVRVSLLGARWLPAPVLILPSVLPLGWVPSPTPRHFGF